jgi:hypothetical protein
MASLGLVGLGRHFWCNLLRAKGYCELTRDDDGAGKTADWTRRRVASLCVTLKMLHLFKLVHHILQPSVRCLAVYDVACGGRTLSLCSQGAQVRLPHFLMRLASDGE